MKVIIYILLVAFSSILYGQTEYEKVIVNGVDNSLNIISSSDEKIVLELSIGNYFKQPIKINGEIYYSLNFVGESLIEQKGEPQLPKITRSIMIPSTSDFVAEIISNRYVDFELPVKPSKGILPRTINPDDVPYSYSEIYSKDKFFPGSVYSLGEPYLIRDVRGIAINFYPFMYNPMKNTLRVFTELIIEINYTGTNTKNASPRANPKHNKYFEPIYKNHFINYPTTSTGDDSLIGLKSTKTIEEIGKMLIICYDDFMDEMQDFVSHKNNIGLPTELVKMSTVGSTANDVKNFIQNKYDTDNSLTFVLLVGNHDRIPSLTVGVNEAASDPSYSLVSGDDNYPDIIIGRFSAANKAHVETQVERSIDYENMTNQDWFHIGAGISWIGGKHNYDSLNHWQRLRSIKADLRDWHYTHIFEFYEGSQGGKDATGDPTAEMVSNAINDGLSIINYSGHGSTTMWETSQFSNTDVNNLKNKDKLPFIFSVACDVGNILLPDVQCFAESWLTATYEGRPTGAIGFYGSSTGVTEGAQPIAQYAFHNLLINSSNITFGALCYNASIEMIKHFGGRAPAPFTFKTWHLFGDPSIALIPNNNRDCLTTYVSGVISVDTTYIDCKIEVSNTIIQNNANVIFDAEKSTTIAESFEIQIGSTLEIK